MKNTSTRLARQLTAIHFRLLFWIARHERNHDQQTRQLLRLLERLTKVLKQQGLFVPARRSRARRR